MGYSFLVGYDLFKTLRIPILNGRDFGNGDSKDSVKVAIINETMAKDSFRQRIRWFDNQDIQIIGVVTDVKHELRASVRANLSTGYTIRIALCDIDWYPDCINA